MGRGIFGEHVETYRGELLFHSMTTLEKRLRHITEVGTISGLKPLRANSIYRRERAAMKGVSAI
jgi:hypothetical protein